MKQCCEDANQSDTSDCELKIAIAGNPNCGKTTLFNILTGARQRVGNWPGVTVERKYGKCGEMTVVDLPGVYTLRPIPGLEDQSIDEKLARDAIVSEGFDVIVNIVDASNLERNLFLTAQLLETGRPVIVALNMMDAAKKAELNINQQVLSDKLGVPVIAMVAATGKGVDELIEAIKHHGGKSGATVSYSHALEALAGRLQPKLEDLARQKGVSPRWLAIRLIEGDDLALSIAGDEMADFLKTRLEELEAEAGEDADMIVAEGRYNFANDVVRAAVRRSGVAGASTSDRLDRIILNRFAGPVVFLAAIYLMFMATINLGGAFIDFFDIASSAIFVDSSRVLFEWVGLPEWLIVILSDGIGGGITVVATFIPIIAVLFLILSFLEDSGYMVRAAFLLDRMMRAIGLPGKAFVPLIVGFGCNVPSIMAARTLERQRDRLLTVMMAPFMSCGARLTVYVLFAAAFFPQGGQNIVFALYLVGVFAAIATGFLLKKTLLKGEITAFVMELPPYRLPRPGNLLMHSWNRLKSFIFGAGKIIVIVVAVLTVLNSIGTDGSIGNEDSDKSVLSAIGRTIVPLFEPIGIHQDNWPATVGIFTGIFAKEAVVGTLNSLYSGIDKPAGEAAPARQPFSFTGKISQALATIPENLSGLTNVIFDPLGLSAASGSKDAVAADQGVSSATFGAMVKRFDGKAGAFAYLLFILLYFPCIAAFSAMIREVGPRWAMFAGMWTTGLAWFASIIFYQTATFAAHPASSALWIAAMLALMGVFVWRLKAASETDSGFSPVAGE